MTQEEKSLLLQDLCERLPYVLYATVRDPEEKDDFQPFEVLGIKEDLVWVKNTMIGVDHFDTIEVVKPYLRPISSMTEDEVDSMLDEDLTFSFARWELPNYKVLDFLNSHHFDYRGLIEKGLALEAPSDMYNKKEGNT